MYSFCKLYFNQSIRHCQSTAFLRMFWKWNLTCALQQPILEWKRYKIPPISSLRSHFVQCQLMLCSHEAWAHPWFNSASGTLQSFVWLGRCVGFGEVSNSSAEMENLAEAKFLLTFELLNLLTQQCRKTKYLNDISMMKLRLWNSNWPTSWLGSVKRLYLIWDCEACCLLEQLNLHLILHVLKM